MKDELIIPKRIKAWAELRPRLSQLLNSAYGDAMLRAFEELDTGLLYQSPTHGQGHIERTLLFGALIAQNEGLSEKDTRMVLLCCSYHDIGRVDDHYDLEHGKRSAEKIGASAELSALFDDCAVAQAAIAAHAVPDAQMEEMKTAYGNTDYERYFLIARCLKDADNLDRVRIFDLEERFLRFEGTRKMVPLANWVLESYLRKPTILCYGDSNTYGYNSANCGRFPQYIRWPGVLQRRLGSEYCVVEEGLNGRTTAFPKNGEIWKSGLYAFEAVAGSHFPIDVLAIMLGTNDCAAELDLSAEEITAGLEKIIIRAKSFLHEKQGYQPYIIIIAPPAIEESIYDGPFFEEMNARSLEVSAALPEHYRALAEKYGCDFINLNGTLHFSKIDSEHLRGLDHHILARMVQKVIEGKNLL